MLHSCRIAHADWRCLPITRVARSIQRSWQTLLASLAQNHTCSQASSDQVSAKSPHKQLQKSTFYTLGAPPCGQSWVPPGDKVAITYPGHPPKFSPVLRHIASSCVLQLFRPLHSKRLEGVELFWASSAMPLRRWVGGWLGAVAQRSYKLP